MKEIKFSLSQTQQPILALLKDSWRCGLATILPVGWLSLLSVAIFHLNELALLFRSYINLNKLALVLMVVTAISFLLMMYTFALLMQCLISLTHKQDIKLRELSAYVLYKYPHILVANLIVMAVAGFGFHFYIAPGFIGLILVSFYLPFLLVDHYSGWRCVWASVLLVWYNRYRCWVMLLPMLLFAGVGYFFEKIIPHWLNSLWWLVPEIILYALILFWYFLMILVVSNDFLIRVRDNPAFAENV